MTHPLCVRRLILLLVVTFTIFAFRPTAGAAQCLGDCNGNRSITVDELITMVSIALGNVELATCRSGDDNEDASITVDEIVAAVNSALEGCNEPTLERASTRADGTVTFASGLVVEVHDIVSSNPIGGLNVGRLADDVSEAIIVADPSGQYGTRIITLRSAGGGGGAGQSSESIVPVDLISYEDLVSAGSTIAFAPSDPLDRTLWDYVVPLYVCEVKPLRAAQQIVESYAVDQLFIDPLKDQVFVSIEYAFLATDPRLSALVTVIHTATTFQQLATNVGSALQLNLFLSAGYTLDDHFKICHVNSENPIAKEFFDIGLFLEPIDLPGVAIVASSAIRGTVTDAAGLPIAGARIQLSGPSPRHAFSTAEGSFDFTELLGGEYTVGVSKGGYPPYAQSLELPISSSHNGLQITLLPPGVSLDLTYTVSRQLNPGSDSRCQVSSRPTSSVFTRVDNRLFRSEPPDSASCTAQCEGQPAQCTSEAQASFVGTIKKDRLVLSHTSTVDFNVLCPGGQCSVDWEFSLTFREEGVRQGNSVQGSFTLAFEGCQVNATCSEPEDESPCNNLDGIVCRGTFSGSLR